MQDFSNFGLNQGTVSTVGCIVMTLLGAYGQKKQLRKIWSNRDAESVSPVMSILLFSLFASYLMRGIEEHKLMYYFQGIVRAGLFIPILVGIVRFGDFTRMHWLLLALGCEVLLLMFIDSFRLIGFSLILYTAVLGSVHQWNLVRQGNGQVSFTLYLTMFSSVVFQTWYAIHYKDTALLVPCILFAITYGSILLTMARNNSKNRKH